MRLPLWICFLFFLCFITLQHSCFYIVLTLDGFVGNIPVHNIFFILVHFFLNFTKVACLRAVFLKSILHFLNSPAYGLLSGSVLGKFFAHLLSVSTLFPILQAFYLLPKFFLQFFHCLH